LASEDLSPGQALQQSIYFRLTGEVASKAGIVITGFLVIPPRFPALGKKRQCRLFRQIEKFLEPLNIQLKA
jgi:hypothetical protein